MRKLFLLAGLLLLMMVAHDLEAAPVCTSVSAITSWPGTTAPSDAGLAGKVVSRGTGVNVDFVITVPGGFADSVWPVCYARSRWTAFDDAALTPQPSPTQPGGTSLYRFASGDTCTHVGLYKTGATAPTQILICTGVVR